mmetsp:Transcript_6344/g.20570  ORF Transcript_6344/g.20570 Transcript_6344/m.20570 type:complete len:256 (-) Transcript_6344:175-942(-)
MAALRSVADASLKLRCSTSSRRVRLCSEPSHARSTTSSTSTTRAQGCTTRSATRTTCSASTGPCRAHSAIRAPQPTPVTESAAAHSCSSVPPAPATTPCPRPELVLPEPSPPLSLSESDTLLDRRRTSRLRDGTASSEAGAGSTVATSNGGRPCVAESSTGRTLCQLFGQLTHVRSAYGSPPGPRELPGDDDSVAGLSAASPGITAVTDRRTLSSRSNTASVSWCDSGRCSERVGSQNTTPRRLRNITASSSTRS